MNTFSFMKYEVQQPGLLTVTEPVLVHEPALKVQWKSGSIWSHASQPDLVSGGYNQTVAWPDARVCIDVVNDLIKRYPDYYNDPGFVLLLEYERFNVAVPKSYLDDMLRSTGRFTYYVNGAWAEMYRVPMGPKYLLQSIGPVQSPEEGAEMKFLMNFSAMSFPATLADLITVTQQRRFTLFKHGIGVYAPGKTAILHTNARAEYIDHPELGEIPAGLQYLDFSGWDGARYEFSEKDLKITG